MNTQRISVILTILSLFLFTSLATPDVQAATYSFTTFDVPGAIYTTAKSINASGQVTGDYWDHYSANTLSFMYSSGTCTTLNVPGAERTEAYSINDSGQVTGSYHRHRSHTQGFVYGGGTFTTLDVPGATETYPHSINASGQVAGGYSDGSRGHGFVYSKGAFTNLDVPGAIGTWADDINASGQVVGGYYSDGTRPYHNFLYSKGTFTTLDVPGAAYIRATSINDSGQVTGTYCNSIVASGAYEDCHGFVYSNGTLTALDVPGATKTWAADINDSGQVTGGYSDGSRSDGFIATPVCTTPTVTIHTLTTASQGRFRITGSITDEGAPLCALVLANGQFLFTCGDPLPKGEFDLTVPVDDQGQITLFGFSSGLAPFQQTLGPGALPASVDATSCATPKVTYTTAAAPEGRFRLTGSITLGGDPLCALVLANGQFLFTCGDPLPKGDFDLTVPPDDQGKITLFGFAAGLAPFQRSFSPSPSTSP